MPPLKNDMASGYATLLEGNALRALARKPPRYHQVAQLLRQAAVAWRTCGQLDRAKTATDAAAKYDREHYEQKYGKNTT